MYICKICNTELPLLGMSSHLRFHHQLNAKSYYDKYLRQPNEGKCLVCGKETKFEGLVKKYNLYCSRECANSSSLRTQHIADTNLQKYGTTCSLASKQVREKVKNTNLERYGVENPFAADSVKQKIKATNIERYGVSSPARNKQVQEKTKQTCLNRYGVEYSFQSENNKEKSKQTCLERYGVSHPWKSTQLRQQQIEKFCIENKLISLSELNLYNPNKVLAKFNIQPIEYMTKYFISDTTDTNALIEYSNELLESQGTVIERELDLWLTSLNVDHEMRNFSVIKPLQLDCYIPNKQLAIEIDGIYWHSYNHTKDKYRHLIKTNKCLDKNIRLIHITDIEWNTKTNICKSLILSALNIYEDTIYARKCKIKLVDKEITKDFINNNHIQGYINAPYHLGLFYNDELVQIISIGKSRYKKDEYELLRMCTKLNTQVIGGFSKLIKNQPYNNLVSYVDKSKFNGKGYLNAGFTLIDNTKPNYSYFLGNNQISRLVAQKHKLPKLLGDKFDPNKTEAENMMNAGYLMLYDCGNYKMLYIRKE